MKVGILGSGDVAKTLATGFLKHGHDVTVGSRTPAKLTDWAHQHAGSHVASFADAAKSAELVVLVVKGTAAAEALRHAGAANLQAKTIIDATNPIAEGPPLNGVLKYFTDVNESLMERLQREFPSAHFVKAFNSVGNSCMVNPQFKGGKPSMFICGNDDGAKKTVTGILEQLAGKPSTWGRLKRPGQLNPYVCFGVFRASFVTIGSTHSSYYHDDCWFS